MASINQQEKVNRIIKRLMNTEIRYWNLIE